MAEITPHQNPTDTVPKQVTLGEQTFVIDETPELKELVESITKAAQKVEKNKLYQTIEGLKKQVKDLEEKINVAPPAPPVPANQPPTNGQPRPVDPNASDTQRNNAFKEMVKSLNESGKQITAEDVAVMINQAFQTALPETLRTIIDPVQKELRTARELQVTSYREARLAQLGDSVIPELVKGNNEAEIEASIPLAREIRTRYQVGTPSPETPPPATPPAAPVPPVTPVTPPPVIPRIPLGEEQPVDIKNMSTAEFARRREELAKNLNSVVAGYPVLGNQ